MAESASRRSADPIENLPVHDRCTFSKAAIVKSQGVGCHGGATTSCVPPSRRDKHRR